MIPSWVIAWLLLRLLEYVCIKYKLCQLDMALHQDIPNVVKFKNVIQLLCLVPVQVWSSLYCCSHCPCLSFPYPQICNLCFCMCLILSKHSSFLQWCFWTLQYCSTLLVRIFILIALGVISSPFYRWRNRGTENISDLSRVSQLPSWCPVWSVVSCLDHRCALCACTTVYLTFFFLEMLSLSSPHPAWKVWY